MLLFFCMWLSMETTLDVDLTELDIFRELPIAVSDDGVIVIANRFAGQLVFLNNDGTLRKRAGTRGQGPGEFQMIGEPTWIEKDNGFWVTDRQNGRFSCWDKDGNLIQEVAISDQGNGIFNMAFLPGKHVIYSRDPAGHFDGRPYVMLRDMANGKEHQVWEKKLGARREVTMASVDGNTIGRLLDWDPRVTLDTGKDFVAIAWSEENLIHLVGIDGKSMGKPIEVKLPTYPLSKDDVERQVARFPEWARAALKQNLIMRENWPPVSRIKIDSEGRIWAFSFRLNETSPHTALVFDKTGRKLGETKVPSIPGVVRKDHYYTVVVDEEEETARLVRAKFKL